MKFKIILIITTLFLFSSPVFAGFCIPTAQVYLNSETKVEKQLSCESRLNTLTEIPFSTTSFSKSEIISNCTSRNISSIQELTFQDFSIFDKTKIIANSLFKLLIVLFPLILLIIVSKNVKLLWIRIFLDVIIIAGFLKWLLIILVILGSC